MEILLLTLLCLSALAQLETPLILGGPPLLQSLPNGGCTNYFLQVPALSEAERKYIIFATTGIEEGKEESNLYIATFSSPNSTHYEWKCSSSGIDACIIPKQCVNSGKTFHIAVHCTEKCMYNLSVQLNAEEILEENTLLLHQIQAGESQIFKVQSNPLQGAANDNIQSISIVLSSIGVNSNRVKMYVSKDNILPSSKSTLWVIPTLTGFTFKAYRSEVNEFCINCTYLVLITTKIPLKYSLKYTRSMEYVQIVDQQFHINDVVKTNQRNCHEYHVKGVDQILQVLMNTYSGSSHIRVNQGTLPSNLQEFQYHSKGENDEQLSVVDPVKRVSIPGKYYICIYSRINSIYSLSIYTEKADKKALLSLPSRMTRTMPLKAQEFQVFTHEEYAPHRSNVSFVLVSLSGNADLFVKFCTIELDKDNMEKTSCELTVENREDKSVSKSKLLTSVDKITLPYYLVEENTKIIHRFLIGVYGEKKSKFALTIIYQEQEEVLYYSKSDSVLEIVKKNIMIIFIILNIHLSVL